ncbi:putative leader peptide [Saccharopolyspora griseoalba]|uniref:Leader peptide n=1 Tax=Saccharopolyspora griseoalba TaxID=1431848 RepID=A0ABW2LG21_9PSEU
MFAMGSSRPLYLTSRLHVDLRRQASCVCR